MTYAPALSDRSSCTLNQHRDAFPRIPFGTLEVRLFRLRSVGVPVVIVFVDVFGADRFRPITDHAPISHASRPRRRENTGVLHRELDLQPSLDRIRIDDAAPVEARNTFEGWYNWPGRIYGSELSLSFGGGFAVDQPVTSTTCSDLVWGVPKASTVENGATLILTVSITSVSPSYQPTE